MIYTFQVLTALLLDFLFGDPRWFPHPVRGIGLVCRKSEKITRNLAGNPSVAGLLTVVIVLTFISAFIYFFLKCCYTVSWVAGDIAAICLLYSSIAIKDLMHHSMDVYHRLVSDVDLKRARIAVGRIVGRDTGLLSDSEISKACVETVAENMVDGITAPIFFALLFSLFSPWLGLSAIGWSAIGAFFYKGVNTMDSMIGYKNDTYIDFGRTAAIVDDVLNFFPARISGFILIFTAFILKLDYRGAAKIFFRDRLNHSSPNAGHTEAAVAGALDVQLGGSLLYSGVMVDKPFIGDSGAEIGTDDIKICNRLVLLGSILFVAAALIIRGVAAGLLNGN
ncbi:MAG: cobalamin biosynthesis protein CobD [Deltaproteobacteria bacterium]|nr:cobalamin biosynthesis protein CobD [Deltaproteobacteria bacterium]